MTLKYILKYYDAEYNVEIKNTNSKVWFSKNDLLISNFEFLNDEVKNYEFNFNKNLLIVEF